MTIFTTTATNAAFYQTLAVVAASEAEARTAFDAYLAGGDNQALEAYEAEQGSDDATYAYSEVEAHQAGEDGDYDVRFDADGIVAMPGMVEVIESGGNG